MTDLRQLYSHALDAFDRGDWQQAYRLASQVAAHAPQHGEVHFIAGVAALQLHQVPHATSHLQQAVQCAPGRADYHAQYGRALSMAHRMDEAIAVADAAMALPVSDATTYDTLGVVYSKANAHGQAANAFKRAVELAPQHANYRFNLATSFMYYGDLDAAESEYEACISIDPTYWRAHLALSQLRRQTPEHNHTARIDELLSRFPQRPDAELHLHLALAKEFEDLGDYPRAFDHYVQGKSAYSARIGSTATRDATFFDAIERYFDKAPVALAGHDSDEPIFVMGMPRSGTTLTDRILSSHSAVQSAGELGHFAAALLRAGGRPVRSLAETITNLDPAFQEWTALGRAYVDSTRPITGQARHFVDKLPHNFLYAGFIACALPNAKLICLRRDPMDTCLSNFRQLFAPESPYHGYSFDLLDTGRYYLRYERLMKRWQELFPGRMLEISYEHLVESQEAVTRSMLEFCGLPWEDACLSFQDNVAPAPTASAVQVRSAMNRLSVQRWKRYETQLSDLRRLLEDGGVQID